MVTLKRILVTGGGTFLGDNIAAALLAEGADVTLLVRPGTEERLGMLGQRLRWWSADVWNPASLKGRARGQQVIVHTVGGMHTDPGQGLTHHYLNFISARNIANLGISSGVPQMLLLSAARAPWISGSYIAAKREAEAYMDRVGLRSTIIRAPLTYMRGGERSLFWQVMSVLGGTPPLSWLAFGRIAPIPIDVLARGVARIAMEPRQTNAIFYASDLRRRNSARELRSVTPLIAPYATMDGTVKPIEFMGEEAPFGWTPPAAPNDTSSTRAP
jgi:uncharacterized protein YbjT (DUF2867 family)